MKRMARFQLSVVMALVLVLASVSLVSAQLPANQTQFTTSITYQNVGTAVAHVTFQFFNEKTSTAASNPTFTLNAGAGSSLFVGSLTGSDALPANFQGSAVLSSDQPIVATLVQVPQNSTTVKNRPLSSGFSTATSNTLLATVLKNKFNTNSKFSIQNADTGNIDITLKIFNADNPSAAPIQITETNIPQGSAKYYDMGTLAQITTASFNGSATVTAVKSGTTTPANIVASVEELGLAGSAISDAKAFEGVSGGNSTVFMATALCNVFGGTTTSYAVQNVDTTPANVTVTYATGQTDSGTIAPGTKQSFIGCTKLPAGTSSAATITGGGAKLVVIGKVFGGGLATAFLGEGAGATKLALPYVRYCNDAQYSAGNCQRTFIAIQNIGSAAVSNVTVSYQDKNGTVVGTHTIASIAPGAKGNSTAINAGNSTQLIEFGTPAGNPGGGFGGAVVIQGPAGSQLIAIARVQSKVGASSVAEDYNGTAIQ